MSKVVAKVIGEVFIIPDSFNIDELNTKTDIHLWIAYKELDTNLISTGFKFIYNDKKYFTGAIRYKIPVELLPVAEKETSVIKLPDIRAFYYDDDNGGNPYDEIEFDIELTVTANQLDYRNRSFEITDIKVLVDSEKY